MDLFGFEKQKQEKEIPKSDSGQKSVNIFSAQLARDLEQAFNQIGASMMSDDFAAKLLAYVLVCGGANEAILFHEGLNAGIMIAQQKFNIFGGEIPAKASLLIRPYAIQLEIAEIMKKPFPEWIKEIEEKYNIKLNHY